MESPHRGVLWVGALALVAACTWLAFARGDDPIAPAPDATAVDRQGAGDHASDGGANGAAAGSRVAKPWLAAAPSPDSDAEDVRGWTLYVRTADGSIPSDLAAAVVDDRGKVTWGRRRQDGAWRFPATGWSLLWVDGGVPGSDAVLTFADGADRALVLPAATTVMVSATDCSAQPIASLPVELTLSPRPPLPDATRAAALQVAGTLARSGGTAARVEQAAVSELLGTRRLHVEDLLAGCERAGVTGRAGQVALRVRSGQVYDIRIRTGRRAHVDGQAVRPDGRGLVEDLRKRLVQLYLEHGAVHSHIGKMYPYRQGRNPETFEMLQAVKRHVDPKGLINPGALGLP